jgi:hypothetical protein
MKTKRNKKEGSDFESGQRTSETLTLTLEGEKDGRERNLPGT